MYKVLEDNYRSKHRQDCTIEILLNTSSDFHYCRKIPRFLHQKRRYLNVMISQDSAVSPTCDFGLTVRYIPTGYISYTDQGALHPLNYENCILRIVQCPEEIVNFLKHIASIKKYKLWSSAYIFVLV